LAVGLPVATDAFPGFSKSAQRKPVSKAGDKEMQGFVTGPNEPLNLKSPQQSVSQPASPDTTGQLTAADLETMAKYPTDLPNLRMVSSRLLRGGQPSDHGVSVLKQYGVKTIVNLRTEPILVEKERRIAESLGIKFIHMPMFTVEEPNSKTFDKFLSIVTDPQQSPVFVHCFHGKDRTGTVIGAYRIAQEGWTFDAAFKEMMACGFRPAFAPLTQGLHKFAREHGDKSSSLPTGSFIMSDLVNRFHK